MVRPWLPWLEQHIDPYIWALAGAALGGLASALQGDRSNAHRIESMLVGIFGAFVGGDFLVAMLWGRPDGGFSGSSLAMATAGAVVMLALLSALRRAVGPLRPAKKRAGRRR